VGYRVSLHSHMNPVLVKKALEQVRNPNILVNLVSSVSVS